MNQKTELPNNCNNADKKFIKAGFPRRNPMTPFYNHAGITILNGHILEELAGMEAESMHMICTSPPYWGLRDYGVEGQMGGVNRQPGRESGPRFGTHRSR